MPADVGGAAAEPTASARPGRTVGVQADGPLVRTERFLSIAATTAAGVVVGSSLLIALARIDDTYGTIGPPTALSFSAAHGTLYPRLFDGTSFGGTRYMPLQFVLDAAVSLVTGEYFVSAKIVSALVVAALLALVYVSVRGLGCEMRHAVVATGAALATAPVLIAGLTVRLDSLAVLLQLAAVTALARRDSRRAAILAGVLCGLAFLAKLSAIWAPIAIVLWLWRRGRPKFLAFVGASLLSAGIGVLVFAIASDGRLFDIHSFVATGGAHGPHQVLVNVPRHLLTYLAQFGETTLLLAPLAFLAVVLGLTRRALSLYQLSMLAATLVTLVVLTDEGATWNHLIDLGVLMPLAAAELVARGPEFGFDRRAASALFLSAATLGLGGGYVAHFEPQLRGSLRGIAFGVADPAYPRAPLAGLVSANETLLSEDASVAVSRDQRPAILDPYTFLRLVEHHPVWRRALERRIDARVFDKVVLLHRLEPGSTWYTRMDFGRPIAAALERNYRLARHVSVYWVYVPR